MALMLDLLLIAAVCVFIVDVSGWTQTWKGWLAKWSHAASADGRLRPFDCSLCCAWWAGLLWCLCTRQFTLPAVALCALAAASTPLLLALWNMARTLAVGLVDWLERAFDRIFYA